MSDHFSSSDDDFEELLEVVTAKVPKTIEYFESTVPRFSDEQYTNLLSVLFIQI